MIKNTEKFKKLASKERIKKLKALSFKKGIKILERIISSKALSALIYPRNDSPMALDKALKHAI